MTKAKLNVMSFNTESGSRPGFFAYLVAKSKENKLDVIALQEVHNAVSPDTPRLIWPQDPGKREYPLRPHLLSEIKEALPDYHVYYGHHIIGLHDQEPCCYHTRYGQALLVRKDIQVNYFASDQAYGQMNQFNTEKTGGSPSSKVAASVMFNVQSGKSVLITNVHGFWSQNGKVDMPERLTQNDGIASHIRKMLRSKSDCISVLCLGDLNYRSDMSALEHLRAKTEFGFEGGVVLNHVFGISRTRTDYYQNWVQEPEADFLIASPDLAKSAELLVADLTAPSDHAALFARFII